jgi:uncharacterized protein (DUF433 family)
MDYRERIVIDPAIRFGKPRVRGTRITVGDVLSYLASGMSEDQILADFPQIERADIRACLAFAAERERRSVSLPASADQFVAPRHRRDQTPAQPSGDSCSTKTYRRDLLPPSPISIPARPMSARWIWPARPMKRFDRRRDRRG